MKRWPGLMSTRIFAILLLGILASALLTLWLAFGERQRAIGQFRESHQVERVEHMLMVLELVPPADQATFLHRTNHHGFRLDRWDAAMPAPTLTDSDFSRSLAARLGNNYQIKALLDKPARCQEPARSPGWSLTRPPPPPLCERVMIQVPNHGQWLLTVSPPRNPVPPPRPDFSWLWWFIVCVAALAWLVARMTTRPLAELAQAAVNLGRDINHPPLQVRGAHEIRLASSAFNAMAARIRKNVTQRTQMLAAITHDLQTPLTRLRLRLEKVQDEALRDKLVQDLGDMQQMVKEGLDLARSIDSTETMQLLDIDSLLDSVCCDAFDAGQAVSLSGSVGFAIHARPVALRRCLVNLIDNAVKYGQTAQVSIAIDGDEVCIRIRDRGPGIPEDELARVFEPFYRLESSRSRESGGTGLGLTIALNVAEQHGGSLSLANLAGGGLEACLRLPRNHFATPV
jgi:signal transduction histidine kinase